MRMENQPLVSVIVPVYNAGDYLKDCLDSILNQTYENWELLLIEDGSTDSSGEVCDAFAEGDIRIQVVHQENAGAATARKQGILLASGEYICFVDADDRIDAKMLEFFVEHIGECDMLTSGCSCEDLPGKYHTRMDSFEEGVYDTQENMQYFMENMIVFESRFQDGVLPFLWNKMYRAKLLKDAVQEIDSSIVYAEDRDLLFRCILKSKSIRVVHESFYCYRYKSDSIMRMANKNIMSDLNKLYLSLERTFTGHPLRESLMHQLQLFILSRIYGIPWYMHFAPDVQVTGYVFPFSELEKGSRIILYGAGTVGMVYYRQIHRQKLLQLVLWVDKGWRDAAKSSLPVCGPERIQEFAYDYIILAVKKKELAQEIQRELTEMGIKEERILWRPPAIL